MYLSPLGAGTLEQAIVRRAILTGKVNRFIAKMAYKFNLSVINQNLRTISPLPKRGEITVVATLYFLRFEPSVCMSMPSASFNC